MTTERNVRLLCLPFAGGSELAYLPWRAGLPSWLQVHGMALPGRGGRIGEAAVDDCRKLVDQLWSEWRTTLCEPNAPSYALFGHSMGALLAYEFALRARRDGAPPPAAMFVSGSAAPARRRVHAAWTGTDDELLDFVRLLGGTPPELLDEPEWRELLLPVLRADFHLCATYRASAREPLRCPIYVMVGDRDPATADVDSVAAWCAESAVGGEIRYFRGGHFYLREQQAEVLKFISGALRSVLRSVHGSRARLLAA